MRVKSNLMHVEASVREIRYYYTYKTSSEEFVIEDVEPRHIAAVRAAEGLDGFSVSATVQVLSYVYRTSHRSALDGTPAPPARNWSQAEKQSLVDREGALRA